MNNFVLQKHFASKLNEGVTTAINKKHGSSQSRKLPSDYSDKHFIKEFWRRSCINNLFTFYQKKSSWACDNLKSERKIPTKNLLIFSHGVYNDSKIILSLCRLLTRDLPISREHVFARHVGQREGERKWINHLVLISSFA